MSVVWRAHDEVLGRDVAVKVLAGPAADPSLPERIRLEARAAAGLRHPNIVEVYDYGESAYGPGPARPYVVMELVEGRTLDQLLAERTLPWREAVLACAQVAAALAAAHARGVVHRDVKPGNVMVTADGVKLVDFGISAAVGAAEEADGEVLGTPAYLAPERLDGGPVQPATDVYALGLLLYRALAGRPPWHGSTVTELIGNHLYAEPAALPPIVGLPPRVAGLVRRCLAKRPEDRPTADEAARILGEAAGLTSPVLPTLSAAPPPATSPAPLTKIISRGRAASVVRRRTVPVVVAVAIAALAMTASIVVWPSSEPRPTKAQTAPAPSAGAPPSSPAPSSSPAPTRRDAGPAATTTATPAAATPAAAAETKAKPVKKTKKPKRDRG
jgi:serine/threonine-protein kinase